MEQQAPDRVAAVETGAIFHLQPNALRGALDDAERELEGGTRTNRAQRVDRQVAAGRGLHERALEKKMGVHRHARLAGPLQVLHDELERRLVVGKRAERLVTLPGEQVAQRHRPGDVRRDDEQVGEQADERLQLGAVAVGRGRADEKARLAGVAMQQRGVGTDENHEERDALFLADAAQRLSQRRRQQPRLQHGAARLRRLTRKVGREIEHGDLALELRAPVVELLLELRRLEPFLLPEYVVGVLDRQRRELRLLVEPERIVERGEFTDDDAVGPAVADNVVLRDHQHVVVGRKLQQHGAQQRRAVEIDRAPGLHVHRLLDALVAAARGHLGNAFQDQRGARGNDLVRLPIDQLEARAQAFVPVHDGLERTFKKAAIERSQQFKRDGNVQRGVARRHFLQQPEAFLAHRRRHDERLVGTKSGRGS